MKEKRFFSGAAMNSYYPYGNMSFYEEERLHRLKKKISRISIGFVLYTFVAYVAILLIQLFLSLFGLAEALESSIYLQWAISLLPLYLFGLPTVILFLKSTNPTPLKKSNMSLADLLLLFLIGRFFTLAGSYISSFLTSVTERILRRPITDATTEMIEASPVWLIFISAVIIGPIVEEFLYRKVIIDRLHTHGEMFAILFSSVIFALAHGNLYQVFYAFLNGCILALIYIRTGKLWYSTVFHMVSNFLGSIAVLPILKAQSVLEGVAEGAEYGARELSLTLLIGGYGLTKWFLALLGAAVLCFCYKQFMPSKRALEPIPHGKAFSSVLKSPGFIAFLCLSILEFALSLL